MGTEGSKVKDHAWLHREFEANLSYIKLCLQKRKKETEHFMVVNPVSPEEAGFAPSQVLGIEDSLEGAGAR